MSKTLNKALGVSVLAIAWAASAMPAFAQTAEEEQASDRDTIVVTAQKKAENVQDVPIAITALNAAALEAARVPCAPVLRPEEVIASTHLAQREFFPTLEHPVAGPVRVTASPYHLDGRPVHPRSRAPHHVGEHSRQVLSDVLGYDAARIDALIAKGVVVDPA